MKRRVETLQNIKLPYGEEYKILDLEDWAKPFLVVPDYAGQPADNLEAEFLANIERPTGSEPLQKIVRPARRVGIIVPDITRKAAVDKILPLLLDYLNDQGIKDDQIKAVFASGIHKRQSDIEQTEILGRECSSRLRYYDQDAYGDEFVNLGQTRRGTPVELNKKSLNNDTIILIGGITFHYFAGFGGGRKLIMPGIASAASCAANHLLALEIRLGQKRPLLANLKDNPVHQDMVEACQLLNPSFLINVLLNTQGRVEQLICGHWQASHDQACCLYLNRNSVKIPARFDVVIVSAGGFPGDINFIQAHKAIEMAYQAVKPGGIIITLAECRQGWGHPDFLPWFQYRSLDMMKTALQNNYQIYGQTAWATRFKAEHCSVLLLSSLDSEEVRQTGLIPIEELKEGLRFIRKKYKQYYTVAIMPYGAKILPSIDIS